MNRFSKKLILSFIALVGALGLATFASPQKASAAGETYTWKDYRTIVVTGGDTRGNDTQWTFNELLLAVDQGGPGLTGDQIGIVRGNLLLNKGPNNKCFMHVSIYIFKGNTQGFLWAPPPYGDGQSAVPNGFPGDCEKVADLNGFLESSYHNKYVDLKGTRPTNPDAPERPEEQQVWVLLNAPEPFSKTQPNATFTLKKDGGGVVGTLSAPKEDDSGAANYPPDQTPATYTVQFEKIEPGKYEICVDVPQVDCVKFEKKKRERASVTMGKRFEMPHERKITVKVVIPFTRPCGSTYTVSPYTVTITGPAGQVLTKETPPGKSTPSAQESGAICTVNGELTLVVEFIDGVENGTWKACIVAANQCADVVKKPGEPAEVTIRTEPELVAPEEDPVCSTGLGVAGMLAWIMCPATELMIRTTEFLERNLIIPFLTVSPIAAGSPIYSLWESMRNIANVLFIVAFLIVIFSQATSIGISNYGIKRLLPRLALVAVGTNLSFFIVAFAIDAFNVFGAGISQLVMSAISGGGGGGGASSDAGSIFALTAVTGVGITIAAAITSAGAVLGWVFGLIGIAFLIILVAVIVLVLRQMLIIMLVVLSPLAFVAWLLPNTERYFTRWRDMLIQLLMMYPMIVLLFASGKIFQRLIVSYDFDLVASVNLGVGDLLHSFAMATPFVFLAQAGGLTEQSAEVVKLFMGFFAAAAPLVFLPATFMASSNLMGRAYNAIRSRSQKGASAAGKKIGERASPWLNEKKMQMARSNSRTLRALGGSRVMRREAKRQSRLAEYERAKNEWLADQADNPRFARQSAGIGGQEGVNRVLARGVAVAEKAEAEDLKNNSAILDRQLRSLNIDQKTFASVHLKNYLKNGTDDIRDASGRTVFRFSENQHLMKAALNSAAAQGEVSTMEEARLSPRLSSAKDQQMVDGIIRHNDGALKSNGGYHLATNFNLANGRMTDASGAPLTGNAARQKMETERLVAMAGSGSKTIAGMNWGLLEEAQQSLQGPNAAAIIADLDARGLRSQLKDRLFEITDNLNTLSAADHPDAIRNMHARL